MEKQERQKITNKQNNNLKVILKKFLIHVKLLKNMKYYHL